MILVDCGCLHQVPSVRRVVSVMSEVCAAMEGQPHAVMFPYPVQGHINPMLQLARRLLEEGFVVTFVNTEHNHARMLQHQAGDGSPPNLRLAQLPDGLPPAHGRFSESWEETTSAILALPGPFARLMRTLASPAVTCIIGDSFCSWLQDVADQFQLPRVAFWTTPLHATLAYHFQPALVSEGLLPLKGGTDPASQLVSCIPGVVPFPLSDYISFFLLHKHHFFYLWFTWFGMKRADEALWNLGNNVQEIEDPAFQAYHAQVPNFLPIGPLLPSLHGKAEFKLTAWPEEWRSCEEWLDLQAEGSVLYVSFGSIANIEEAHLDKVVKGLEDSGVPFLWAIRPDQQCAPVVSLGERLEAQGDHRKGLLVSWAPQIEVLNHKSVGGFCTHCGWNSILESIVAGVPMLANPGGMAEQNMNAHYIANVWRIGERLPRAPAQTVKDHIIRLMGVSANNPPMRSRISALQTKALSALSSPSASSKINFQKFVEDMYTRARVSSLVT